MIIYIAELSHTAMGRSPNVVPLAAGYLAATAKKEFPDIDIRIFRDPNELLETIKLKQPDILGFSVHLWSERLSAFCAQRAKEISKSTIIVVGGPSIDDLDLELVRYLQLHPYYDICIPNEGEISFLRLIEYVRAHGRLVPDEIIEGCASLASNGSLLRGAYTVPDLSSIPSPYLGGFLDTFLHNDYEPIIQSMRGCPYSCKFCVSGTSLWSKIRGFDLETVFEEFNYIKERTRSGYLILTDENFGILKERDVLFAEYMISSFKNSGFPRRLYFYTAKIVTDYVLEVINILAPIGELGMSFQTLNDDVIKEIKRTNLRPEQFIEFVTWAKERKILTSTEMIFGFPGETVSTYVSGLEWLLRSGVDRVYSYNLRLFNGIDLNTQTSRNKYNFKTMYRLPERTFGCYNGTGVTEVEEVVVGSNSYSYNDYLQIRKYGLFLELSSGCGYFSELIQLMVKLLLPGEKLIRFFSEHKFEQYPRLNFILETYMNRAKRELFETPEECVEYVRKLIASNKPVPEVKLNLIFTGKLMLDEEARGELFEGVKDFVRAHSNTQKQLEFFTDYIDNILAKQIVLFHANEKTTIQHQTKVRLELIEQNRYGSLDDLLADGSLLVDFALHNDAITFIRKTPLSNVDDEKTLQDIYMTVSKLGLLRQRKIRK